jgi:hypothetical protein
MLHTKEISSAPSVLAATAGSPIKVNGMEENEPQYGTAAAA